LENIEGDKCVNGKDYGIGILVKLEK